jgi:disulfide bond formation protein DsbB
MNRLYIFSNLVHVWVLITVLFLALCDQFLMGILPCPLCVLQRIALILAALGPVYVLGTASRRSFTARDIGIGAGITILASLLGLTISTRQILLHILPGDTGYGPSILGYHLYTWALFIFICNLFAASLQLIGLTWFHGGQKICRAQAYFSVLAIGLIIIVNIIAMIAEAGFAWHLPSNPTDYLLFKGR